MPGVAGAQGNFNGQGHAQDANGAPTPYPTPPPYHPPTDST